MFPKSVFFRRLLSHKYFWVGLLILFSAGLASINFPFGYFEDIDVVELIKRAWRFGPEGYGSSRNWGFPLYEMWIYPVIFHWGLTAAKVYSLIFYVLSVLVLFQILHYWTQDCVKAFLGAGCFLVHPLAIISGNAVGGTSQEIFLALIAFFFFIRCVRETRPHHLYWAAFFCGLATATRQDYLVFSFAIGLTLLIFRQVTVSQGVTAALLFFITALSPYLIFYGFDHFAHLHTEFLANDTLARESLKALFGYMALFGLPLLFGGLVWLTKNRHAWRTLQKNLLHDPIGFLFLISFLLYFIRLSLLASKLEYVWMIFPILVTLIAMKAEKTTTLILFLVLTALPNVVQIHFFEREGIRTKIYVGLSLGAIAQDRIDRLKFEYICFGDNRAMIDQAAKKFGCEKYFPYAYPSEQSEGCFILPEERLRFLQEGRFSYYRPEKKNEAWANRIIVFPMPESRGWRQFHRFVAWKRLTLDDFKIYQGLR